MAATPISHKYVHSEKTPLRPKGVGARHIQTLMMFLCLMLTYSTRTNLSIAIVAMTDTTGDHPDLKVLQWTNAEKGTILGSFFWGYLFTNLLAGSVAKRLGPKYPLLVAMLFTSLFTAISPYVALNTGWFIFCLLRVMLGLAQGFIYSSIYTHVSKWVPPLERGKLFGFILSGSHLGIMLTMAVSGYLADSSWGWPSIFYCTGLCGLLWGVAWMFVGADSPDSHSYISDTERLYIKSSQPHNSDHSKTMKTPWREVVTSLPVWSLVAVSAGHNWGYWMLVTEIPSYLKDVFNFDIKGNGLISTLPYISIFVLTLVFSWISDLLIENNHLTVNTSRKMWNTIAHWGGAAALVSMYFLTSPPAVVAVLTLSVGLIAGSCVGYRCNHLDLAPNFAGLLMGLINGLTTIFTILGPTVTGLVVSKEGSKDSWMIAFCISALMFFFGNLLFITLGSTEVQPWNEPKPDDKSKPDRFS